MALDYNWIVPQIAQGSFPSSMSEAFKHVDSIVFCAEEKQPPRMRLPPGKLALRLPFDDDIYRPIPPEASAIFHQMANRLAREVKHGRRILITCAMGLNRSGLITALTLMHAYGMPARDAIRLIRARRHRDALMNPMFEQWLLRQSPRRY